MSMEEASNRISLLETHLLRLQVSVNEYLCRLQVEENRFVEINQSLSRLAQRIADEEEHTHLIMKVINNFLKASSFSVPTMASNIPSTSAFSGLDEATPGG